MMKTYLLILAVVVSSFATTAPAADVLLYDADGGVTPETPEDQNWGYITNPTNLLPPGPDATITPNGTTTALDTTTTQGDSAGFFTHDPTSTNFFTAAGVFHPSAPVLDRITGFRVTFDLKMNSESHDTNRDDNNDGKHDRAGFSVLVVSSDLQALELGFFHDDPTQNEIWAYEDDLSDPADMFTQAEGVNRTEAQTGSLTRYELTVLGNSYDLAVGGISILSGPLRNYEAFPGVVPIPGLVINPYDKANMLFFGDDTSSADSDIELGDISVTTELIPEPSLALIAMCAVVGSRHRRRRASFA
jgi:hypothetical protein